MFSIFIKFYNLLITRLNIFWEDLDFSQVFIFALCIFIPYVIFLHPSLEIDDDDYLEIDRMIISQPSIKSLIKDSLDDGEISIAEYDQITDMFNSLIISKNKKSIIDKLF